MRVRKDTICDKSLSCGLTMLGQIKRAGTKNIASMGLLMTIAVLPCALAFAQEFSADLINRAADGKVSKGKLYRTAEKERVDLTVELQGKPVDTHMIFDWRERVIYLVEPQQNRVLINHALQGAGSAFKGGSLSSNPCEELMRRLNPIIPKQQFTCRQVGHETVNGRGAEKWQTEIRWLGNGPAYLWVDSQIRTAIKWTLPDGSSGELRNIEVRSQPPGVFELPANYRRLDLPH